MIKVVKPDMGESIEEMLRRTTATKAPIENVAPMIYTERKDGVRPEYNIRTDRFEQAIDVLDKFAKSGKAHKDEIARESLQETQQQETKNE